MNVICWFRQDLRLADNPAFNAAASEGKVMPVYIVDDLNSAKFKMGAASRYWLNQSLKSLSDSLNGSLALFKGDPANILVQLCKEYQIGKVFWNRCYEPWRIKRDILVKKLLEENGIEVKSYNGSLLWEPWEVKKEDGSPYKVFTPFYRKGCLNARTPRKPLAKPENIEYLTEQKFSVKLDELELLPTKDWYHKFDKYWDISENGAIQRLKYFIKNGMSSYKEGRNYPAKDYVSRLSPYLHFGEISVNQIWYEVMPLEQNNNTDHFCSELGWREFSYSLLYHNPDLAEKNLQSKFDNFPWDNNSQFLEAWQKGETGIPIVDAGMREMWETGYMHNRVRMIVASFLIKNLLLDWRLGERWFWDCLLDADMANNSASWQWVAGSGADAAPYFRIFNPVSQGQKFDPDGEYTKKYLPELKNLPVNFLFNPWEAPDYMLNQAGVVLGKNYPRPIVDLSKSRERALAAFKSLSNVL